MAPANSPSSLAAMRQAALALQLTLQLRFVRTDAASQRMLAENAESEY